MTSYWLLLVAVQVAIRLSVAQMGFGGGGYCAKCAMARSGMNSNLFGFGGMASNPGFGPGALTSQVSGDNVGVATVNNLASGMNPVDTQPSFVINPSVDASSSTPSPAANTNPCANGNCIYLPDNFGSAYGGQFGQFGGLGNGLNSPNIVITRNAMATTDSSVSESGSANSNPNSGAYASTLNLGNVLNGQLLQTPFGSQYNSLMPFNSVNPFNGFVWGR